MAKKRKRPRSHHLGLTCVALALIGASIAGFFLSLDSTALGVLLVGGVFLLVLSVFYPRIQGDIVFPWGGKISLKDFKEIVNSGEDQLDRGEVEIAEELTQ